MAVLQQVKLEAVGVVVTHALGKSYVAQDLKEAGLTATRAERTKLTRLRNDVSDHAVFRFVLFVLG